MTKPTDEGTPLDENLTQGTTVTEEPDFVDEPDPMLEEAKAAEAEIAAAAGAQAGTEEAGETGTQEGAEQPAATGAAPKDKGATPMIPKARLDEVLSENSLLKDQLGYLRGLADANKGAAAKPATETAPAKPADGKPAEGAGNVDPVEAAITAAEEKKLALAEKYDNGEISSKQWKEEEIKIDKEIRQLSDKRIEAIREESRKEAQNLVSANNFEAVKNSKGLELQALHPNVAVIDSLNPRVRDGVWQAITDQASANLAAQGVDVKTPQGKLLLITEKARLTDDLSPYGINVPAAKPAPAAGGQPAQPKNSEAAQNRKAKIDLANSQPPSTADMGAGAGTGEITEADIEKMTEDQVADLITKAPNLVTRIMGTAQRG